MVGYTALPIFAESRCLDTVPQNENYLIDNAIAELERDLAREPLRVQDLGLRDLGQDNGGVDHGHQAYEDLLQSMLGADFDKTPYLSRDQSVEWFDQRIEAIDGYSEHRMAACEKRRAQLGKLRRLQIARQYCLGTLGAPEITSYQEGKLSKLREDKLSKLRRMHDASAPESLTRLEARLNDLRHLYSARDYCVGDRGSAARHSGGQHLMRDYEGILDYGFTERQLRHKSAGSKLSSLEAEHLALKRQVGNLARAWGER